MPSVQVGVKMQNGNGLVVDLLQSSESCQRDAVVATQRDDFRVAVAVMQGQRLACHQLGVRARHLVQRQCIVKGGHGDVATVEDPRPRLVRVDVGAVVEPAEGCLSSRRRPDGPGAEPGA